MIGLWITLLAGTLAGPGPDALPLVVWAADVAGCPAGEALRAVRGIGYRFTAGDFVREEGEPEWVHFLTEPVVERVDSAGPSAGRLEPGDVIVAIDGHLITTASGSRRFWFRLDGPIDVHVMRRGEARVVPVAPMSECAPVFGTGGREENSLPGSGRMALPLDPEGVEMIAR